LPRNQTEIVALREANKRTIQPNACKALENPMILRGVYTSLE
jgi:hypothetical protein